MQSESPVLEPSRTGAFLERMQAELPGLLESLMEFGPALEKGATVAQLKGVAQDELEEHYAVGYDLCQQQAWDEALPVFLNLLAHDPRDARFAFAAGMCFQQLGEPAAAAIAYTQALLLDPSDAASAFRAGETCVAVGQPEQAAAMFTLAMQLIDANYDKYHHLRQPAQAHLRALGERSAG